MRVVSATAGAVAFVVLATACASSTTAVRTGAVSHKRILYVVGMEDEQRIASGDDAIVVVSGANRAHLERELAKVDASQVSAVLSFGVAGALRPWLRPGAIVVADGVVDEHGKKFAVDRELTSAALLRLAKLPVHRATFLGMDSIIIEPAGRARVRSELHAGVVDMESHIAAQWAAAHHLPFAVVRTISDASTLAVPDAMLHSINADGTINIANVASSVWSQPSQIPTLVSTSEGYAKALDALARCRRALSVTTDECEPCPRSPEANRVNTARARTD